MKVKITRISDDGFQTAGKLEVCEDKILVYSCHTIEPPWKQNKKMKSCIPVGVYVVKKRYSPRFKRHFHVMNIPGRTWILIHAGNFRRNSTGCILVGKKHADIDGDGALDLTDSRAALNELLDCLPNRFHLEIRNDS